MIESIIDAKPTCASSCRRTTSSALGSRRRRARRAIANDARRQQALGLQLLAAEAHDHDLAAEVRVQADVAQRPDRDQRVGRVDRDAAAVAVLEADDVVDVRVARQQLGLDALDRELDDAGDALHRRRDREDVARADRAVGVAVALEGVALERRQRRRRLRSRSAGRRASAPSGICSSRSWTQRPARDRARPRGRSRRRSGRTGSPAPIGRRARPCGPAAPRSTQRRGPRRARVPAARPPSLATIATLSRGCIVMQSGSRSVDSAMVQF